MGSEIYGGSRDGVIDALDGREDFVDCGRLESPTAGGFEIDTVECENTIVSTPAPQAALSTRVPGQGPSRGPVLVCGVKTRGLDLSSRTNPGDRRLVSVPEPVEAGLIERPPDELHADR